jgi:hypothetical protein
MVFKDNENRQQACAGADSAKTFVSGPFNQQAFNIAFGFRRVERKRGFRQKTDARVDYMQPCSHNGIKFGSASHVKGPPRVDFKGRLGVFGGLF